MIRPSEGEDRAFDGASSCDPSDSAVRCTSLGPASARDDGLCKMRQKIGHW